MRIEKRMDHFITNYNIDCPPGADSAVLEDSIMQKGRVASAGSKMLENFVSPIDATVVTRLESAGIKILGKTKMDEFGVAGLFADLNTEISGAAAAVADGEATFALCNDYTGAVRRQAAPRGVCYIHPTYGTVSRYGLIPAVPSMDQIGIACKVPEDGFRALSIIAGNDPGDGAMYSNAQLTGDGGQWAKSKEKIRIGIPANVVSKTDGSDAVGEFAKGFDTVDFELKYFDVITQVMRILCCAEISGCTTRYDGIKFGYRADGFKDLHELYTRSRTEALGPDVKLAAMIGAMVVSQEKYDKYYDRAMRIRRLIKESLDFNEYDMIIMPAPDAQDADKLALSALPQLCGLPSVTVPFRNSAITLIAGARRESMIFSALKAVSL